RGLPRAAPAAVGRRLPRQGRGACHDRLLPWPRPSDTGHGPPAPGDLPGSMTTIPDTRPLRHWLHGADGPHLVISCAEHPDTGIWSRAITEPGSEHALVHAVIHMSTCVAQVTPAVLLELVAGGASGITVALDGCANPTDAEAVVARAGAFLSALGRPETIDGARAVPRSRKHGKPWSILRESAVPVSRRVL